MTEEPETWLGNIQRAAQECCCEVGFNPGAYCNRCGNVHRAGECLRGDR